MFLRKTIEKQKNKVKTGKSRLWIENIFAFLEKLGDKVTHYFNLEATTIHNVLVDVVIFMLFQLLCDIIVDVFQIREHLAQFGFRRFG